MEWKSKDRRWELLIFRKPPLFHIQTPWFKYSIGFMFHEVREGRRKREVIKPVHALSLNRDKSRLRRSF